MPYFAKMPINSKTGRVEVGEQIWVDEANTEHKAHYDKLVAKGLLEYKHEIIANPTVEDLSVAE